MTTSNRWNLRTLRSHPIIQEIFSTVLLKLFNPLADNCLIHWRNTTCASIPYIKILKLYVVYSIIYPYDKSIEELYPWNIKKFPKPAQPLWFGWQDHKSF